MTCSSVPFLSLVCILACLGSGLVHGSEFECAPMRPSNIIVDMSGNGHFTTVQGALDSIPIINDQWRRIVVMTGDYWEKVVVEKPCIVLLGSGINKTNILFDAHFNTLQSATFTLWADHFVARSISFWNTYNMRHHKRGLKQAVAALVGGDKTAFYDCSFTSMQDTLWDHQGRHYFRNCFITGAVDFIFGAGQSIYEECKIQVIPRPNYFIGCVTAQGREKESDPNGFVFKNSELSVSSGYAYLGRPWREYARVLFYQTNMVNGVVPQGWDASGFAGNVDRLTYAEHGCWGQGSNTSQRVQWEKKLSADDVYRLADIRFIDEEGWLTKQPKG